MPPDDDRSASSPDATTADAPRATMLVEIEAGYDRLLALLDTLDDAALAGPVDGAGWTANDHVIHLALWAGSMLAVFDRRPRWEAIGVSRETWATIADGYDEINAQLQRQHAGRSTADVRHTFEATHRALVGRVERLSAKELMLPYSQYQPWSVGCDEPLYGYVLGNTVEHYDEHRAYIAGIVGRVAEP